MRFLDELKQFSGDIVKESAKSVFLEWFDISADITVDILDNHIKRLQGDMVNLESQELFLLQELIKLKNEIEDSYYKFFEEKQL